MGLTEEAFPELAPLWPSLSAYPALEVVETFSIERAAHCLHVAVAGDFAPAAVVAWNEAALALGCEGEAAACRGVTLAIGMEAHPGPEVASLEALAVEMGVPSEPSAVLSACVPAYGRARLARIDERLHRAGLLEPWRELHERLGTHRFVELRWSRTETSGIELSVHYRADPEARELAVEWAREAGLLADDDGRRRIEPSRGLALELDEERIELLLIRDPE